MINVKYKDKETYRKRVLTWLTKYLGESMESEIRISDGMTKYSIESIEWFNILATQLIEWNIWANQWTTKIWKIDLFAKYLIKSVEW